MGGGGVIDRCIMNSVYVSVHALGMQSVLTSIAHECHHNYIIIGQRINSYQWKVHVQEKQLTHGY